MVYSGLPGRLQQLRNRGTCTLRIVRGVQDRLSHNGPSAKRRTRWATFRCLVATPVAGPPASWRSNLKEFCVAQRLFF
jgi:hypothetical protein